jgi:hypothetical protein
MDRTQLLSFKNRTDTGNEPRTGKRSRKDVIDQIQRHAMISDAAYYLAQRRGFYPGRELDDWLQAERQLQDGFLA